MSAEIIFCTLFMYLLNPSFIIALWLPLATECTGISKVYCKLLMNIPAKIPSASTTIIFGSPNVTNKFPKSHSAAWSDVIYFISMAAPIPNPVIQSRNVRILQDKSRSGMSPCIQKSINTTLNRVSESIVWTNCCVSWDHEFTNWKCAKALIKWAISLLTIGHKKRASILNKFVCSWLWLANGDTSNADITTCMNLTGSTLSLSCLPHAQPGLDN